MSEHGKMRPLELVPVSPDLYCPHCGRILVSVHDGTFDLHGKAAVTVVSTVDPFDLPEDGKVDAFLEARCLRRRCRFKAWRRDVTDAQYTVLGIVAGGPIHVVDAAAMAGMSNPTTGKVIASLCRRSLITISMETERYVITQRGRKKLRMEGEKRDYGCPPENDDRID